MVLKSIKCGIDWTDEAGILNVWIGVPVCGMFAIRRWFKYTL